MTSLSRRHCPSVLRPPNILSPPYLIAPWLRISDSPVGHLTLSPSSVQTFSTSLRRSSASPSFNYSISAAYSDKRHKPNPSRNLFTFDPSQIITKTCPILSADARKLARAQSGQDAFFASRIGETNNVAFGVVDGVGGWEESGVDPADFAHSLCHYMADAAEGYPAALGRIVPGQMLKPRELLDVGYRKVMKDPSIPAGGSTACIATVSAEGLLNVANLGDSGYAHLSPFRLNFHSPAQTHRFNTPFQLSKFPPKMLAQVALFGGAKPYAELPSDAALTHQTLSHGDILIFATDGVWDNLSPSDILSTVSRLMLQFRAWAIPEEGSAGVSADFASVAKSVVMKTPPVNGKVGAASINGLSATLATAITLEAKEASLNEKRDGPFAKEVQRLYPDENWRGGKSDDICTVVAVAIRDG